MTFLLALLWLPNAFSEPKETLFWLLRDLPPLSIFEGEQKGQGVIDLLMPQLIASLPEYQQQIVRVNRARGMQMLREPTFVCDPSLIMNKEREQWVTFSITSFRVLSNGLVIRRADHEHLTPFVREGKVDLRALLASGQEKVGVVAERSYGQQVDNLLHAAPADSVNAHHGNDALGSLLQMQRLGRLEAVLGYWPEIRYHAMQQGIAADDLSFYPIKGTAPYQRTHIGCSDTPQGREVMEQINQVLLSIALEQVQQSYAAWLDPAMREHYLRDNPSFFQDSPEP